MAPAQLYQYPAPVVVEVRQCPTYPVATVGVALAAETELSFFHEFAVQLPNIKSCTIQYLPSAIFFTLYVLLSRASVNVQVEPAADVAQGVKFAKVKPVAPDALQQTATVNTLEAAAVQPALLVPVTVTVLAPAVGALIV
jgi:hypothetical protein